MFSVAPDRRELKLYLRSAQPVRGGDHTAVLDVAVRAQLAQAGLMHVQRPGTDRIPTGQRHPRPLAAANKRTQDAHRGPKLAHGGEVSLVLRLLGCGDANRRTVKFHIGAQTAQNFSHQRDIENVGAVGDRRRALGQQAGRHQLQNAVLGAADGDLTSQPVAAGYQETLDHRISLMESARESGDPGA